MAIDYKEIGSNIKVCRIRKNLKQAQLAEIVGVSSQHISHIECGRTTVSLPLLISIAQALSVDLYALLDGIVESRPKTSFGIEFENILKMQRQINSASACQFAVQLWSTGKRA